MGFFDWFKKKTASAKDDGPLTKDIEVGRAYRAFDGRIFLAVAVYGGNALLARIEDGEVHEPSCVSALRGTGRHGITTLFCEVPIRCVEVPVKRHVLIRLKSRTIVFQDVSEEGIKSLLNQARLTELRFGSNTSTFGMLFEVMHEGKVKHFAYFPASEYIAMEIEDVPATTRYEAL